MPTNEPNEKCSLDDRLDRLSRVVETLTGKGANGENRIQANDRRIAALLDAAGKRK